MPKHRRIARKKQAGVAGEPAFQSQIRDLTSDGRGVAPHPDGRTFFVSGVWPGETALIQPVGRQGKVGLGRVVELQQPHLQRRSAPCHHHGPGSSDCGGCPWMFMTYEAQGAAKQQRLDSILIGLTDTATRVDALLFAPEELGYRNRAQFKTDGRLLGYLARGTRKLIDIDRCPVLSDGNAQHLAALRTQLPNPAWHERKEGWQTIDVDDATRHPSVNKRLPFRQGNTHQNGIMRSWLAEVIADYPGDTPVTELFAGSGNLTEVLVEQFNLVKTVESHEGAASLLAARLGDRVQRHDLNLYSPAAVEGWIGQGDRTRLLVIDPPREGLKVRDPLLGAMPDLDSIVYLSCDTATWARDAGDFLSRGFRLARVTPLDLFPQTPHLELLSVFKRG